MAARLLDGSRSRAFLFGCASYASAELHDLPGVTNNLRDLRSALTDSRTCGLAEDNCTVVPEPVLPDTGLLLEDVASQAEDCLIVYYSGHGVPSSGGRLYLALGITNPNRPQWTALDFALVRSAIANSRAKNRILILDCCFSGRAIEAMSDSASLVAAETEISGTYTLTSSAPNVAAVAPSGARNTAFTGALLSLVNRGLADDPSQLMTLDSMYKALHHQQGTAGYPEPRQRGTDTVQSLALFKNAAGVPAAEHDHPQDREPAPKRYKGRRLSRDTTAAAQDEVGSVLKPLIFGPQMDLLLTAHPDISVWPPDWASRGQYDFLFRPRELLVRGRDEDTVRRVLPSVERVNVIGDIRCLKGDISVVDALDRLDAELGSGIATPNHVFTLGLMQPETEPAVPPVRSPQPPVSASRTNGDITVALAGSGFLLDGESHAWLKGVVTDPADFEDPDSWPVHDGFIDPYAGHGTFAAGVLRCVAPGVDLRVHQVFDHVGVVDELALARQLDDILETGPDVLVVCGGGYTRQNRAPISLVALYEQRLAQMRTLLVAPAGDDGTRRAPWPAAFPWVLAVGALDEAHLQPARFSNTGSWVDVYAPGESLVNAYAKGTYRSLFDPDDVRHFPDGICMWGGTAFAAAIAAGTIASRMSDLRTDPQTAAAALKSDLQTPGRRWPTTR